MTVRQKQWQLYCLGYLGEDVQAVDGAWGQQSMAATRAFQKAASLEADGLFGPKTEAASRSAVAQIQKALGLPADGLGGPVTLAAQRGIPEGFWDSIPNFSRREFACQCGRYCDGYPAQPKEAMVRIAQAARDHFGRPARVVSGLRCPRHNASVGGVPNSQHMAGEACDLAISGVTSKELLSFLQAQSGVRYAYAINETNVHFDIPKGGN